MNTFDITASALTAQRLRLDTISSNLANVNTTRQADGTVGAYRRKNVVFAPVLAEQMKQVNVGTSGGGFSQSIPLDTGVSMGPDGKPLFKLAVQNSAASAGAGVQVVQITDDTDTPLKLVYDPSHPDANADGYVEMPNVNVVTEMVDMISATRAYEANVTALQSAKGMMSAALEL